MKKIIALLCAMVLAMSTMTAFAAPSITADIVTEDVESAVDKNNEDVEIKTQKIQKEKHKEVVKAIRKELKTEEGLKKYLGDEYEEGMRAVSVREVIVVDENGEEVHDDVAAEAIDWPVTVTFKVKGVTKESKVVLLHWSDIKEDWEVVESTPGDGVVIGKFYSFSPVMFLVDNDTADAIDEIKQDMGETESDEFLDDAEDSVIPDDKDDVTTDDKEDVTTDDKEDVTTDDKEDVTTDDKEDTTDDEAVKTGDDNQTLLYGVLLVAAIVIVGGVVVSKKRA